MNLPPRRNPPCPPGAPFIPIGPPAADIGPPPDGPSEPPAPKIGSNLSFTMEKIIIDTNDSPLLRGIACRTNVLIFQFTKTPGPGDQVKGAPH